MTIFLANKKKTMQWSELRAHHLKKVDVFYRSSEVQERYKSHVDHIASCGMTLAQYMNTCLFRQNQEMVVTVNDFPYDLERGVAHLTVWLNPNIKNRYLLNFLTIRRPLMHEIAARIREDGCDVHDLHGKWLAHIPSLKEMEFAVVENAIKSVPSIPHVHLFIQKDLIATSKL